MGDVMGDGSFPVNEVLARRLTFLIQKSIGVDIVLKYLLTNVQRQVHSN